MGLSIARTIVEAHHGQISAKNGITAARRSGSVSLFQTGSDVRILVDSGMRKIPRSVIRMRQTLNTLDLLANVVVYW